MFVVIIFIFISLVLISFLYFSWKPNYSSRNFYLEKLVKEKIPEFEGEIHFAVDIENSFIQDKKKIYIKGSLENNIEELLCHELAHYFTVEGTDRDSHSDDFWKKYHELKSMKLLDKVRNGKVSQRKKSRRED